MSRDKMVVVEIDEEGNCKIEAHGFIGVGCESAVKEISDALGERVTQERKREYYQREGAPQHEGGR